MAQISFFEWQGYAESFAFFGNSLLGTMRRTPKVGLRANFWSKFPTFGSSEVAQGCERMEACVRALGESEDAITELSEEFTRLFVGSPEPAVPPCERSYVGKGSGADSDQPLYEMRELLRKAQLELKNEEQRSEDHMGIELMYLSVLCSRIAQGEVPDAVPATPADVQEFLEAHLLRWMGAFCDAVATEAPEGYYHILSQIMQALAQHLHSELRASS